MFVRETQEGRKGEGKRGNILLSPSHIRILPELYATFNFVEKHICPVTIALEKKSSILEGYSW